MRTVLWIDDSPLERDAALRMLSHIDGVDSVVASSSDEAEQIIESRHIDCVITDILRRNPDKSVSTTQWVARDGSDQR